MRLNEIMKAKKITSERLSALTGIPITTIAEYRGARKKEPSFTRGMMIADAIGIDPHDLIEQ